MPSLGYAACLSGRVLPFAGAIDALAARHDVKPILFDAMRSMACNLAMSSTKCKP